MWRMRRPQRWRHSKPSLGVYNVVDERSLGYKYLAARFCAIPGRPCSPRDYRSRGIANRRCGLHLLRDAAPWRFQRPGKTETWLRPAQARMATRHQSCARCPPVKRDGFGRCHCPPSSHMRRKPMRSIPVRWSLLAVALIAILVCGGAGLVLAVRASGEGQVHTVFSAELPNVPGKTLTSVVVEYAPGGSSAPHRHAGSVFAYVLSGQIRSENSATGPVRVYRAGETFFEPPPRAALTWSVQMRVTRSPRFSLRSLLQTTTHS